jgi:hypothetical protein
MRVIAIKPTLIRHPKIPTASSRDTFSREKVWVVRAVNFCVI